MNENTTRVTVREKGSLQTTRRKTPEGFLRARATITRSGILTYDAAELGIGPKGKTVRIYRTEDSLFNETTYEDLRGRPITVMHPDEDDVTPMNWSKEVVGNIAGNFSRSDKGHLLADIIVGDARGIKVVENGMEELSIGAQMMIEKVDSVEYDYRTISPILTNHIAIVNKGRAGSNVRIHESESEEFVVNTEDITKIADAVVKAIAPPDTKTGADSSTIAQAVKDAVSPVVAEMEKMKQAEAKREAEVQQAKAKDEAKKAAEKFEAQIVKRERKRAAIVADAKPFLTDEKMQGVDIDKLSNKEILVKAVGDSVQNAAGKSEDYLQGVLDQMNKSAVTSTTTNNDWGSAPMTGPGNQNRQSQVSARDQFISSLENAWKSGNPLLNPTDNSGG